MSAFRLAARFFWPQFGARLGFRLRIEVVVAFLLELREEPRDNFRVEVLAAELRVAPRSLYFDDTSAFADTRRIRLRDSRRRMVNIVR